MKTMNEMELEQVNGAGLLTWRIPNFPTDQLFKPKEATKETPNYKLPELDVDNRPAITPPPFCPTLPQAK